MTSKASFRATAQRKLATWALALVVMAAFVSNSAHAVVVSWSGVTSTLWATGTNWTGNTAPANDILTDIARFNLATYNAASSPFAPNAGTRSILGIQIGSSSGALTLSTTNLSIGASGINMEAGAAATSIGKVIAAVDQTWTNNSANTLTFTGANVYTGRVTLNAGAMTFNGAGTGAGGVTIDGAAALTSQANAFGTGTLILNAGSLNVNANRDQANTLSITGDFTFRTEGNGPTYSGLKSTTGNRIITFQEGPAGTSATGNAISFTTNAIVLGGNLELKVIPGGVGGAIVVKPVISGGIDLNNANRTLTLSSPSSMTIGLLTLSGDLTITGSGAGATAFNGGFNTAGVNRTITFNNSGGAPTLSGVPTGAASTVTLAGSSTNATIGAITGATANAFNLNSTTGGTFTFNGASTFSGGVTVTSGVGIVASTAGVAGTSGPLGTGALIINGGRLESQIASGLLGSSAITVNGGELRATATNSLVTNSIPITLNGGTLRGFNAASINYGAGAINVTATSSIVNERSGAASATSINETFGTSVAVGNSQLNVTSTDNQTGGTATVSLGAGTLTGNGIFNVTKNPSATDNTVLSLTTLGVTGSGNSILNGNGSVTASSTTSIGGASSGALTVQGAFTSTGLITVATNGTLTADSAGSTTARITGTAGIAVNGSGSLLLTNSTGTTSTDRIGNATAISLGGGTLGSSNSSQEGIAATRTAGALTGTSTVGLGALTLSANSTIDFDSLTNGNLLVFANGYTNPSNSFTLSITNWTNANFNSTANSSGLSIDDRLVFNQDMTSFLPTFDFGAGAGVGVSEVLLDTGFYEVGFTPVPEPSTWVAGLLTVGVIGYSQRRRLRGLLAQRA